MTAVFYPGVRFVTQWLWLNTSFCGGWSYGVQLRKYCIGSRGQPKRGEPTSQYLYLRCKKRLVTCYYLPRGCGVFEGLLPYDTPQFLRTVTHLVELLGQVISPSEGLYLHKTVHHRKTRTNIVALSGTQTHDSSVREIKTHTL